MPLDALELVVVGCGELELNDDGDSLRPVAERVFWARAFRRP